MTESERTHAYALVNELFGPSDDAADRVVEVLHAHAAALAWVRDTTGTYPAPGPVADALNDAATRLRTGADARDPVAALVQVAADALDAYRTSAAA